MNFVLFFLFYILSTCITALIIFLLYKFVLKKLLLSKAEKKILDAFNTDDDKSILDIPIEKKEMEEKNEKVYTYF